MAENDVMLEMDRRPINKAKTDEVPQHLADAIRDIPADKIDLVGLDQLTPAKRQIVLDKKTVLEASGVKVVGFRERHIKGRASYLDMFLEGDVRENVMGGQLYISQDEGGNKKIETIVRHAF